MMHRRTWRAWFAGCLMGLALLAGFPAFADQLEREDECPPPEIAVAVGARLVPSCDDILGPVNPSTGRRDPSGRTLTGVVDCRAETSEILSRVMCTVESKLTAAASMMYCGVADAIKKPLALAILLYITIFGFTIALGISKLTFSDAVVRGIKISLVWLTATQAQYGLSLLYQFFMGIVREGIRVITRFSVWGTESSTGVEGTGTCGAGSEGVGTFLNISELTGNLLGVGAENGGAGSMLGVLMHFVLTDPILGFIGVVLFLVAAYYLAQAFLRVVMAYLLALMVIAFLVSLAPIFIMLALFNQYATFREYFDNWLNTLASHAIQPIFLFAVLFFVVAMMATNLQFMSNMARPCAAIGPPGGCAVQRLVSNDELQMLQRADGSIIEQPSSCTMFFNEIKIGSFLGLEALTLAPPGYIIYYGAFDPAVINAYEKEGKCVTSIDVTVEGNREKGDAVEGFIYKSDTPGQGQVSFCGNKRGARGSGGATNAVEEGMVGRGSCGGDFSKAFIFNMLLIIIKCGLLFAYLDSSADHIAALATRFAERLGGTSPFTERGGSPNVRMLSSNYSGALNKLTSKGKPGGGRNMIDKGLGVAHKLSGGKVGVEGGLGKGQTAGDRSKELLRATVNRVPLVGEQLTKAADFATGVKADIKNVGVIARNIAKYFKK